MLKSYILMVNNAWACSSKVTYLPKSYNIIGVLCESLWFSVLFCCLLTYYCFHWNWLNFFQNSPVPTVSMYLTPVNDNDSVSSNVFKGQTVILTTDITIPTGSQHKMNFTLVAPSGSVVDIVAMDVVLVGINLPCIARNMFSSNLTSLWVYFRSP